MTTPATMNSLIERLALKFAQADIDWRAYTPEDPEYEYTLGYRDAIGEILEDITGDPVSDVVNLVKEAS